jgi:hypothetical protein
MADQAEQHADDVRICIPRHIVEAMIGMAQDPRLSAESVVREIEAVLKLELQHAARIDGTFESDVCKRCAAWNALRVRLRERFTLAREVLEENELGHVAALVPIEEVLIWMDELEGRTDG